MNAFVFYYSLAKQVIRMINQERLLAGLLLGFVLLFVPAICYAGIPWEAPLTQVTNSLAGPVARSLLILAIVSSGVAIAFSEGGSWIRYLMAVVMGGSCIMLAVSFLDIFGTTGG